MARSGRRVWIDPRFLIGLGLVVVAVLGTVGVVTGFGQTSSVWAASATLLPGEVIGEDDVEQVEVRLGTAADAYLAAAESPAGLIVATPIRAGELIPVAALADAHSADLAAVVVTVQGPLPQGLAPGAVVDVWVAAAEDSRTFGPPELRVEGAVVVGTVTPEGIIADRSTIAVELLVPRDGLASLLASIANDDVISLVPQTIPAEGAP